MTLRGGALLLSLWAISGVATVQTCDDPKKSRQWKDFVQQWGRSEPTSGSLRQLGVGETAESFYLIAELKRNYSGVRLTEGYWYQVDFGHPAIAYGPPSLDNSGPVEWCDSGVEAELDGWSASKLTSGQKFIHAVSRPVSRYYPARLYSVVGAVEGKWFSKVDLGVLNDELSSHPFRAEGDGELYLFANDVALKYDNNHGYVVVAITRVVPPQ